MLANRERPKRVRVGALVAAMIMAGTVIGVALTWVNYRPADRIPLKQDMELSESPPILRVDPIKNLTGEARMDWLGEGLSSLIRDELTRSRLLVVADPTQVTERLGGSASPVEAVASGSTAASYVVHGEISNSADGLVLTTTLSDLTNGFDIATERYICKGTEDLLSMSVLVARLVRRRLNMPGSEQAESIAADFAAGHIAAYESYVAGMQDFVRFDYAAARNHFLAALKEEPAYAMARYRLSHTLAALGDTATALAEIERTRLDASALPDREQRYIRAAKPYFSRDYAKAELEYKSLLIIYPHEREARQLLIYILYDRDKYAEALENARALTEQEPGSEIVWGAIAELNLKLHRYDEANSAVQRFLQLAPNNPNAHFLGGEAAYLRGRLDEARPQYEAALRFNPQFGSALIRLTYMDVLQGLEGDALARLEKAASNEALSPSDRISAAFDWAYLLRAREQCEQVTTLFRRLDDLIAAEEVREALALSVRSSCARDTRHHRDALRLAQQAVIKSPGTPTRYLFARGMAERAAGDLAALKQTIIAIDDLTTSSRAEDQTKRKAARYLEGQLHLAMGEHTQAAAAMRGAIRGAGYAYELYPLGLAEALLAAGDRAAAEAAIKSALAAPFPDDLRLDLEASRRRAREILKNMHE